MADRRTVVRGGADVVLVLLGCGVLLLAAWPVDAGRVPGAEAAAFRVVNGTTVLPFVVVWPVMQLGNVAVVPVSAFVAAAFRRWRLAAELLVAGALTYFAAKVATLTALAAVAWPWLGRRGRMAVVAVVVLVCLARVYVGAHLPLDVIGGAGLGLAVAGLVRLALGRPA